MKDLHDVIIRPVLTEKGIENVGGMRYVFEVPVTANKFEIKQAVETVFAADGVKVDRVNTVRTLGKVKRQGLHSGRQAEVKKAYVTLKKDSKPIKFFDGYEG
jgi:large subunit ribosomal protein L23